MTTPWPPDRVRDLVARLGTTQQGLARLLGVNPRTVRDWCADGLTGHGTAALVLDLLDQRIVTPPPATLAVDMDRDGPAGEALDPHLDELAERAERAGWHPAEIVAAALSWSVQRALDGAGPAAARQLLDDAAEAVEMAARSA